MKILYHIDRSKQLKQGVLLNNTFLPFFSADVIDNSLKELNSKLIEIMAECIRHQSFSNHISRFQAMFVTDTESIEKWILILMFQRSCSILI